ncbi:hypothetical protein, partial [Pseudomonas viridiflava]|uniref:hypothetical protein n=1 Tax=Pseudomonas viridiflava TaxID=33069 RepID=UPI0019D20D72
DEAISVTPLSSSEHPPVGGGLPAICRVPAAKPARAVRQMQSGAAAQPIAAVVTCENSHALWAEADGRAFSVNDKVFDWRQLVPVGHAAFFEVLE